MNWTIEIILPDETTFEATEALHDKLMEVIELSAPGAVLIVEKKEQKDEQEAQG